jgi:hypothetical protein
MDFLLYGKLSMMVIQIDCKSIKTSSILEFTFIFKNSRNNFDFNNILSNKFIWKDSSLTVKSVASNYMLRVRFFPILMSFNLIFQKNNRKYYG